MKPSRLLLPFVPAYGAAVALRNWLYERGTLPVHRATVPVISVGNITAGGTGKTPFIEHLIRVLNQDLRNIVILSRGYGRTDSRQGIVRSGDTDRGTAGSLGDELRQIALKFPAIGIIADADRSRAARYAVEHLGAELLLLDDGFQHRALARDLDIVLIDATQPLQQQHLLPAGYRREPVSSLKRAALLAYTRVDDSWHPEMKAFARRYPGIHVRFAPVRWRTLDAQKGFPLDTLRFKPAVGFCGIGNPAAFASTLSGLGVDLREVVPFPDHHWYTGADVDRLTDLARRYNAVMVTTEKDAARLDRSADGFLRDSLYALEIQAEIVQGEELLRQKLNAVFGTVKQ